MSKRNSEPVVVDATAYGRTEWRSEDWVTVGRFRGTTTKRVTVRDAKGKPALAAHRYTYIEITCAHWSRTIKLHGKAFSIETFEAIPDSIQREFERTAIRCNALFRATRKAIDALPVIRAIAKKAA